ncbi:coiled-coil and C2 domain-containing protein 1B isoform X1 [Gadus morhua]|nr:coiled-coil and C2 domain-containing protein 1B isoform X1 [Gadus morhua]
MIEEARALLTARVYIPQLHVKLGLLTSQNMFGKKKAPMPKGHGAAAAKKMGLFVDMSPEEMLMGMDDNLDDPSLEAELAAITGDKPPAGGRAKPKGKAPLPMEDIARMADDCMKDLDEEDDDDDLEDDEDLLAELQEVVGEEETGEAMKADSTSTVTAESSPANTPGSPTAQEPSSAPGSLQRTLEERRAMYKTALENAKAAGESSRVRRYDRGLKALETMLTAVTKGRSVNEADVPPPVSTGAPQSQGPAPPRPADPQHAPADQQGEPSKEEECSSSTLSSLSSPVAEAKTPTVDEATRNMLLERQREYRVAALRAKKQGAVEQAKLYVRTSKKFDAVMEALEHGTAVDLSGLPPPPPLDEGGSSAPAKESSVAQPSEPVPAAAQAAGPPTAPPTAPRDVLEALEQRRAKYAEASAQAKAGGDDRKARMHDRIAKQYQSAIRTHKAGKPVNFEELPTPPGFPPIPGQKGAGADQGLAAALETANQLATTDPADVDEDGEEDQVSPTKPTMAVPPMVQPQRKKSSASSPVSESAKEGLSPTGTQQLDFLEGRRKQYMRAALQAKQKKDLEQAKGFLRSAKALEPLIEAARAGNPVDISKVPSPPGDEDEDFILVHHSDVQLSEKAEEVYAQLLKILKEQHEKCRTYSKQFTHLGNITETTKFEKMAESCKKNLEILRLSQARGLDPPKHHFEERTHRTVRIFPELSSTEMVVELVKGLNLPAPSGIQANDLDAYVKFDFPYPSTEKPQSHKTAVIKNNNSPEYNQSFTLTINRNHRGFRRVLQSKGLKLEVLHKGGFLRSDKAVGSAVVKLEQLESQSEIREIVEVMDGRKHTGGRIEVKVRLREPLSGQDLQTSTERWLVLDQSQVLL